MPAQQDLLAGLRAGGHLDVLVALECRHREATAERGERCGDVDHRDEVVAVAHEALVVADADLHVEVAGRPAEVALVAASAQPDALSVGDARRHVDLQGPAAHPPAAPAALAARLARDAAVAAAHVALDGAHDLPERRAGDRLQPPGAAAARARLDRRAGLRAVAVAALAAGDRVEAHLLRGAVRGLLERDVDGDRHVAALDGHPAPAAAERAGAEERVEDVAERAEAGEVRRRVAARAQAVEAVAVVGRLALGVRQDLVGLGRLLEVLLGGLGGVDVGVQLAGQPAEGLLDLGVVGVA